MPSRLDLRLGRRVPRAVTWSLALVAAGACARSSDTASADSVLARDLTLAATASQQPVRIDSLVFADTAVGRSATAHGPAGAPVAAPAQTPTVVRVANATVAKTAPPRAPHVEPTSASAHAPDSVASLPAAGTSVAESGAAAGPATGTGRGMFGTGTSMALTTTQAICTKTNRVGDRFVATLTQPATAQDRMTTLPAGTNVTLEVTAATSGTDGRAHMELVARGVTIDGFSHALTADVSDVDRELMQQRVQTASSSDRSRVGKGALTGALLGRIFSRGVKGAVIGAAAGAAVGAASSMTSKDLQACLPRGASILIRLSAPLATA